MATGWENLIYKRVALAKLCLATKNFAPFHVLSADHAKTATILSGLPPEHKADVDKFNTDTVEAGQQNYKEFLTEVESLKGQTAEPKAWELKIRTSADSAKERSSALIEKPPLMPSPILGSYLSPHRTPPAVFGPMV